MSTDLNMQNDKLHPSNKFWYIAKHTKIYRGYSHTFLKTIFTHRVEISARTLHCSSAKNPNSHSFKQTKEREGAVYGSDKEKLQ
jgi:hypothetical protein